MWAQTSDRLPFGAFVRQWSCYSFLLLLLLSTGYAHAMPPVQEGDIIFHTSKSSQSIAIQKATRSRYSHVGIIFITNGKPVVFEAVSTVKFTPLDAWIARGVDKHFVIKRLRSGLGRSDIAKLRGASSSFSGRPYDLTFEWSDDRIYCSELVWKIYERALGIRIGNLAKLGEFDLSSAAVQQKIRERYGAAPPMEEVVISPDSIYDSPLLEEVIGG